MSYTDSAALLSIQYRSFCNRSVLILTFLLRNFPQKIYFLLLFLISCSNCTCRLENRIVVHTTVFEGSVRGLTQLTGFKDDEIKYFRSINAMIEVSPQAFYFHDDVAKITLVMKFNAPTANFKPTQVASINGDLHAYLLRDDGNGIDLPEIAVLVQRPAEALADSKANKICELFGTASLKLYQAESIDRLELNLVGSPNKDFFAPIIKHASSQIMSINRLSNNANSSSIEIRGIFVGVVHDIPTLPLKLL